MALDLGDQVAGERAERTAQQEDDRDLARRRAGRSASTDCIAIVGGRRDRAGDRGADRGPPAPHVAGEEQAGDRREHERAGEAAGDRARGDGEHQLEAPRAAGSAVDGLGLQLVEASGSRANATSAIAREREVRRRSGGSSPKMIPAHDRDPAGRDGEPDEPRLDSGRGLVARGQRGRQAAEPFGWFASGHSELLPALAAGLFTSGFTRVRRQREAYPERGRCRRLADRAAARRLAVVLMVGLTGGIGSGKSTVAAHARRAGRGRRRRRRDRARGGRARDARRWPRSSRRSGPRSSRPTARSTGPRSPSGRS